MCCRILSTLLVFFYCNSNTLNACSTYKVSLNGTTMLGNNYDTWFSKPIIWFETQGIGAAFTGANKQGSSYSPQAGMNISGLAFVCLAAPTPVGPETKPPGKSITNRAQYLKDILHRCKTVEEVKEFIDLYDHSSLSQDVFLYVDRSGRYLIVEPYTMYFGEDAKYVLANFCPSTIQDFSQIKQPRYINGTAFLKNKTDTTLQFCQALSDTMHVCRDKIGDGTLLTSISDLNKGIIYLFFYHDYDSCVSINIKDELLKGDHSIEIPSLFATNPEYIFFLNFITPMNNKTIDLFLQFSLCLFAFSFIYYLLVFLKNRQSTQYRVAYIILIVLNGILPYYMFVFATEMAIYYFPPPYQHYQLSLISIVGYIPFLLLLLVIPLVFYWGRILNSKAWTIFPRYLFLLNNLTYLTLIILFFYWRLFDVF